jgi:hypothetical protein
MSIKVFYSDQTGAPQLSGSLGSLITVMDAVLVNGYNPQTITSMTRTGSTVTVTVAAGHGYDNPGVKWWNKNGLGNYCQISGAEQTEYNGEWAISYVDDLTFTFDIGTLTPDTPATGALETRRAPAGWTKPFADINRAAYRSADPLSRRHFLAVNDVGDCPNGQGARYASWRGFEQMTGLDQWQYPFPTVINAGWGEYFCKSSALDVGTRCWAIISDGKFIFFLVTPNRGMTDFSPDGLTRLYGFGDFQTTVPDPYATFISADTSASTTYNANSVNGLMRASTNTATGSLNSGGWHCIARRYNGQATPVWAAGLYGVMMAPDTQYCFGLYGYSTYPNPYDNVMHMAQIKVTDGTLIRGTLGCYESLHGVQHTNREIITNVKGLEGRHLVYLRAGANSGSNFYCGGLYIDITGDSQGKWS